MELNAGREPAGGAGAPNTVLLIEDDPGDVLLAREALAAAAPELELRVAGTLEQAIAILAEDIACAVVDLGLPDTIGLEAVHALRAKAPAVAVVVLTGHDDERLGIDALGAGAQDYLVKGQVEPEVLARAIRYAVERRRAERTEQALLEAQVQTRENARLERGLLPQTLISDARVRVACDYRPGRRRALLGGDFYDAVELEDGTVHAMIGDVCGHGADEAALGACLRAAWRALALAPRPPDQILATLHRMLPHESHTPDSFATLAAVEIAPDRRSASVWLAGHPPPIVIDENGPRALDLAAGALPLGLYEQDSWPAQRHELGHDWSLLLYTDGMIENRHGHGSDRLGEKGLLTLLEREIEAFPGWTEDGSQLLERLIAAVERLNGEPPSDDTALLLLTVTEA